jgi:hypothetical protein
MLQGGWRGALRAQNPPASQLGKETGQGYPVATVASYESNAKRGSRIRRLQKEAADEGFDPRHLVQRSVM